MKKIIFCCDKCGDEIPDIVYTLTCYGEPVQGARLKLEDFTDMQITNTKQNAAIAGGTDRHLCRKCKDAITDGIFIVGGKEQSCSEQPR